MIALFVLGWILLLVVVLVVLLRREPKPTPLTPDEEIDRFARYWGFRQRKGETREEFRARMERDLA